MASSIIITEDNVSANILAFTRQNFLFTGTVCKSWYKNSKDRETHVHRAVDSITTVDEAYRHSYPLHLYAPYFNAIDNPSRISVFEHLVRSGQEWIGEEVEYAARHGRIDVLQLFEENGQVLDERVLHTAVRYGQLDTLVHLMSAGCPVDTTRIEWGYGDHVVEELKMCSMEMAARDGRLDIMKQLRVHATHLTPFPHETFEYALSGRHLDVLKYVRDVSPGDVFRRFLFEAVWDGDTREVAFIVRNGLVKRTHYVVMNAFERGSTGMVRVVLESMTKSARARAVDQAFGSYRNDGVALAQYLVCGLGILPTSDAYNECLRRSRGEDESLMGILTWLYDDLRIRVNPEGLTNLANHSAAVQQWFRDRCRSCRLSDN